MRRTVPVAAVALSLFAVPAGCQSSTLDSLARLGSDGYFVSTLSGLGCPRLQLPPGASPAAWSAAARAQAAPLLSTLLGPISATPAGDRLNLRVLAQREGYSFSELLYKSRTITNGQSLAYVLTPSRPAGRKPLAIVLHPNGTLPQNVFGVHLNGEGELVTRHDSIAVFGIGSALARAGFIVVAPLLGTDPASYRGLPWGKMELVGANLRKKLGKGGTETLLVSEIQAAIDHELAQPDVRPDQVFLVGEGEGAYLAALTAAVDPRVRGVVRLDSPIDYRAFRLSKAGIRNDAAFEHADCSFGDVAQAVILNGIPLLYASTVASNEEAARGPFRSKPVEDSLRLLYSSSGNAAMLDLSLGNATIDAAQLHVADWLAKKVGFRTSAEGVHVGVPDIQIRYDFPADEANQRVNMMADYVGKLGRSCPAIGGSADRAIQAAVGLPPAGGRSQGRIQSRRLLDSSRGYVLSLVQIGAAGAPSFAALLAEPQGNAARSPAVLAANGEDDLNDLFGFGPPPKVPYLHGYADALARRGFVVIVPIVPDWVPDAFGAIAKAQLLKPWSTWKTLLPMYETALDALLAIPGVDVERVAAAGISFGGTAAAIVTALDPRIQALVYNNIPVDYTKVFDTAAGGFSNIWLLDVCSVANDALMGAAPRPLTWQAGEDPFVQNAGMDIIALVRERYRAVGAEDRFGFMRHWGGHEMFPDLFRIFGR
jgi:dienelactone hydrolase